MNTNKTIESFNKHHDERYERKLKDLHGIFKDREAYEKEIKKNPIIYELYTKNLSPIRNTLTVIYPGKIGKEFYMTRGHIHKNKTPEFYILLEGKGILLMQNSEKVKVIKMKLGKIELIPKGYAHRIINNGNEKLKVLTIYREHNNPNYKIKFKRRFFSR